MKTTMQPISLFGDVKRIAQLREMLPIEADGSIIISFGERLLKFSTLAPEGWYQVTYTEQESISRAKIVLFLDMAKYFATKNATSVIKADGISISTMQEGATATFINPITSREFDVKFFVTERYSG